MKLPFSFSLKFFFRLLFPGFVVSCALFPALATAIEGLEINIGSEHIILISTVIIGWLFMVFDMHIYMAFEGRRYWPKLLRQQFVKLEENRLAYLLKNYSKAKSADHNKYIELSVELRRFPLNRIGEPFVAFPTRLGNLIASYEEYPMRTYGMDSIFYWYRIWLAIDENSREQIDGQQAVTDSSIYISAALYLSGLICFFYIFSQTFIPQLVHHLPVTKYLFAFSFIAFLGGYIIYRGSLHLHAGFGNIYMALFDMHKEKVSIDGIIDEVARLTNNKDLKTIPASQKYKVAWRYMHNYKIKTKEGVKSVATFLNEKAK